MSGPSGPFTPWIQHALQDGACIICGLVPKAVCETDLMMAFTHAGAYSTVVPTGNIEPCRKDAA